MDIKDAINDPKRPLSVSPDRWMKEATQRRGSIVAAKKETLPQVTAEEGAMLQIEMSIDSIVATLQALYEAYDKLETQKMNGKEKEVYSKVKDLLDTAIMPYMSDIVNIIDTLDEE